MKLLFKNPLFVNLLSSSLCSLFLISPANAMEEEPGDNKITSRPTMTLPQPLLFSENEEDKKARIAILEEEFGLATDPIQKLQIARDLQNTNYLIQIALDTSQSKGLRIKALSALNPYDIDESASVDSLCSTLGTLIRDETIPLQDRFPLVRFLEEGTDIAEPVYLSLLPTFSPEHKDVLDSFLLGELLMLMLQSRHPDIQHRAETIFLDNPLRFIRDVSHSSQLSMLLARSEEDKKSAWLQRICDELQFSSFTDPNDFQAACLVLRTTDQDQFVVPAKKVFLKMINAHRDTFMMHVRSLLRTVKDEELKEQIFSSLFDLAQREGVGEDPFCNYHTLSSLLLLLKQKDEKIRSNAIALCQKVIKSVQPEEVGAKEEELCKIGLALNKIDEGKELAKQILTFLQSEYDQILSRSDVWSEHEYFLRFFLKLGNEKQQHEVYNVLKQVIIEGEDRDEDVGEEEFENIAFLVMKMFGPDHLWTQDIIELVAKRVNSDHPNSAFAVHKQLQEKVKQPVDHHLPRFQLDDRRSVTFHLPTLQTRRQTSFIPMKHMEFISLVEQLLDEAEKNLEEFKLLAEKSLAAAPQSAIDLAKKSFFRFLLDEDEEIKETKKVSLISRKLRQILFSAKSLQGDPLSQGLSAGSQLILSLLNNVLTCPTGKEDGVDQTYRLLTNHRGGSEEEMQQERLTEDMREFFMEEMRCIREGLLNGDGPFVRSLLNIPKETRIGEPPHLAKYLHNLLGHEIGLFLEGENIAFDQNGGCVPSKLRECSKQEALDTLYAHHTPEKVIHTFHDQFETQGFDGKVDGKHKTWKIMGELLPDRSDDPNYVIFDKDDVPQSLTPLAVSEFLIKTGILEIVESH